MELENLKLTGKGYESLACEIILQAVMDYMDLEKGYIKPNKYVNQEEIINFFKSNWFTILCPGSLSGVDIMQKIKAIGKTQ